jgi:hypothetical protein
VPNYATPAPTGIWDHSVIKVFFSGDLSVATTWPGVTTPLSYKALVIAGFNEWVTALGSKVSFVEVASATGADVTVSFQDSPIGNSAAWSTPSPGRVYTGSKLTSVNLRFVTQGSGAAISPDLLQLMGAEAFGAVLGLNQSTTITDITALGTTATAPSTRDLNTVKTLYCAYF